MDLLCEGSRSTSFEGTLNVMRLLNFSLLSFVLFTASSFATAPRTWDAIFNAEGQGEYESAPIVGQVRFYKYEYYGEKQPVSFAIKDGPYDFVVYGVMKVPADTVENKRFYGVCNKTREAWISYIGEPQTFGKENLQVNIKGVDIACDDELYALKDLKVKFKNPAAQKYWVSKFERAEKNRRDKLAEFRIAEQEHFVEVKHNSGFVKDARDGQVYRTIKIDGRTWLAQNVNYNIPGESWCYDDKENFCARSGRLYSLEGARKACPKGFHLPRDREWQDMLTGLTGCYDGVQKCEAFASKLKARTGWQGGGGTDEYGFTAFGSGRREVVGRGHRYVEMGEYTAYWSSQNGRNSTIWIWVLGRMGDNMVRELAPNANNGYSVRCIDGN